MNTDPTPFPRLVGVTPVYVAVWAKNEAEIEPARVKWAALSAPWAAKVRSGELQPGWFDAKGGR